MKITGILNTGQLRAPSEIVNALSTDSNFKIVHLFFCNLIIFISTCLFSKHLLVDTPVWCFFVFSVTIVLSYQRAEKTLYRFIEIILIIFQEKTAC